MTSLLMRGCNVAGDRMVRALYGQTNELKASIFSLGISPHINASIFTMFAMIVPKDWLGFKWLERWAERLKESRREGKAVSNRLMGLA